LDAQEKARQVRVEEGKEKNQSLPGVRVEARWGGGNLKEGQRVGATYSAEENTAQVALPPAPGGKKRTSMCGGPNIEEGYCGGGKGREQEKRFDMSRHPGKERALLLQIHQARGRW